MARVRLLENNELDQDLRAAVEANPDARNEFVRVFGHAPEPYKAFMSFYGPLINGGRLEAKLKEMVRLKVASINECSF